MTTSNAEAELYKTSKLTHASEAMRLACKKYKEMPKIEFKLAVANIIKDYDPRERYN